MTDQHDDPHRGTSGSVDPGHNRANGQDGSGSANGENKRSGVGNGFASGDVTLTGSAQSAHGEGTSERHIATKAQEYDSNEMVDGSGKAAAGLVKSVVHGNKQSTPDQAYSAQNIEEYYTGLCEEYDALR